MKKIADIAAYLFILSVTILSAVSILGVWDFFAGDVITKSFESIGLLAVVAVIVLVADHFMDQHQTGGVMPNGTTIVGEQSRTVFKGLRIATLSLLILSVALLALFGIMAIWEVLSGQVLHKSLASIGIVAFSSFVIVITCLEREDNQILRNKQISGVTVAVMIVLTLFLLPYLFSIFN